jgi:phage anti-repressor protein
MEYLKAVAMKQEMLVALQYKDMFPDRYIEVAKKYTQNQWRDCGIALIKKLEEEKFFVKDFLHLVEMARELPKGKK